MDFKSVCKRLFEKLSYLKKLSQARKNHIKFYCRKSFERVIAEIGIYSVC
jgi:hypothetical protein